MRLFLLLFATVTILACTQEAAHPGTNCREVADLVANSVSSELLPRSHEGAIAKRISQSMMRDYAYAYSECVTKYR